MADTTETATLNQQAIKKAHVLIEQLANKLLQDKRNIGATVNLRVGRDGRILEPTVSVESR